MSQFIELPLQFDGERLNSNILILSTIIKSSYSNVTDITLEKLRRIKSIQIAVDIFRKEPNCTLIIYYVITKSTDENRLLRVSNKAFLSVYYRDISL